MPVDCSAISMVVLAIGRCETVIFKSVGKHALAE